MIDLNSNSFESKSIRPFNDGIAGIVEPIVIADVEKDPEKNRWVITYQDSNGGTLRDFYSYISTDNQADLEKQLKGQGITLRHLWKEIVGNVALPTFNTPIEMLDTIMSTLKVHSKGKFFKLVVDYGYGDRHNTNLNRKKFVPFLEKVGVEKSALFMVKGAYTTPAEPSKLEDVVKTPPRETIDDWLTK